MTPNTQPRALLDDPEQPLLSSFARGQSLSITGRAYFQRTGFFSFVGESTFRGVPVSVFIAGHSATGEGIYTTQVAWAFRSKIEVVPRTNVAATDWRVNVDCNAEQILKQALVLVDVRDLDHFIVAGAQVIGFAQRGLL